MRSISGATPLSALDAVAVDCETTGLDTATARIVQLAAVEIVADQARHGATFDTLVDPDIAIPAASTTIHGIDDDMVRSAPRLSEALPPFLDFCNGRVVIGHSIGFDLAVLENETQRIGAAWRRPRSLCVRLLGAIANPRLPEESLDALASWLGVDIAGRHSARGDAIAAAEVFVALAPHLARRGIRTLAEAERACLALTTQLENAHRAGWAEPVTRPGLSSITGGIDPYAYRHRVRDLMSAPVTVVAPSLTTRAAAELMVDKRISSVFVGADGVAGRPATTYGIVTERDIMRQIAAHGSAALDRQVGDYASRPLASIAGGAFVYRAIGRMDRLQVRHLAVRDEREQLAGIITARDLLRLRASAAIQLDDAIGDAKGPQEMARAWATLPNVVHTLIAEDLDSRRIAAVVSEEMRVMTRRAAELAELSMRDDGRGGPPCPYSLLVLGSGGRGESLLAADQDNAIVFEHGDPDGTQDRWFAIFADRLAAILDAAGIPFCTGGVMAKNPAWRGSVALWHERINDWVDRSQADDLLNVDIVFDQRPVQGDNRIGVDLFDRLFEAASNRPAFAKLMAEKLFDRPSPFTMLGGIHTEGGRIDLKRFGLFPVVTAARALAIRHDIRRRSTAGRLEGVVAKGIGNAAEIARLIDAHRLFIKLMLEQQSRDLESGIHVSNKVDLGQVDRSVQADLKAALRAVQTVPDMVRALTF